MPLTEYQQCVGNRISLLNEGGLCIPSTYLNKWGYHLLTIIRESTNISTQSNDTMKFVSKEIAKQNDVLREEFNLAWKDILEAKEALDNQQEGATDVALSEAELSNIKDHIYKELTSKVFNARIHVYFKAYKQDNFSKSSKSFSRPTMRSVANNES